MDSRGAIGIIRVSHVGGRDGESFISPDDQRKRIESVCANEGIELVRVEQELDTSGGNDLVHRPKLLKAVEDIESGTASAIVSAYFTRLTRSTKVKDEVVDRVEAVGGDVITVDVGKVSNKTAASRLTGGMHALFAEYQRMEAKERGEIAAENAVARGVAPFPKLPPGITRDQNKRMVPDPAVVPIVREAFEMRDKGAGIAEVRRFLQAHGIERAYSAVCRMLASPLYLGTLKFGDHQAQVFEPIIDPDLFRRVQKRVLPRGRKAKSPRLLARLGILRCATCGSRMVIGSSHVSWVTYRCGKSLDCTRSVNIMADTVDELVANEVRQVISEQYGRASADEAIHDAKAERDAAQERLEEAVEAFESIPKDLRKKKLAELTAEAETAQTAYKQIADTQAFAVEIDPETDWDDLTMDEKRALIKANVESVIVAPAANGFKGADRVTIHFYAFRRDERAVRRLRRGLGKAVDDTQRLLDRAAQDRV